MLFIFIFVMITINLHARASPQSTRYLQTSRSSRKWRCRCLCLRAAVQEVAPCSGGGLSRALVSTRELPPSRLCVSVWLAVGVFRGVFVTRSRTAASPGVKLCVLLDWRALSSLPSSEDQRIARGSAWVSREAGRPGRWHTLLVGVTGCSSGDGFRCFYFAFPKFK